ncbi:MAG: amidohydrolase family protein [archaeon]|nr:amidohydrolase family protein [archaeon]
MSGSYILSGRVWSGNAFEDGYVIIVDGRVEDVRYGEYNGPPDFKGCVLPGIIDTHTHVADAGLKLHRHYDLEELVAPPNGLKHKYLDETPPEKIVTSMASYVNALYDKGVSRIIDFREGGIQGIAMLRNLFPKSIILGRPMSTNFNVSEVDDILKYADGIGISSISDMSHRYVDAIAEEVHKRRKILALHVSERVREDMDYVISLKPNFVVHMVYATNSDIAKCVDNDIPISVCPRSNFYFGIKAPVNSMINAGASVSIGTDNAMLTPDSNIFNEAKTFYELLSTGNRERGETFRSLIAHGRELLHENSALETMIGNKADIVAIPCGEEHLLTNGCDGAVRFYSR